MRPRFLLALARRKAPRPPPNQLPRLQLLLIHLPRRVPPRLLRQLLNQPRQSHRLQHVVSRTSEESTSPPSLELVAEESYPSQTSSLLVRELTAPRLLRAHQTHHHAAAGMVRRRV